MQRLIALALLVVGVSLLGQAPAEARHRHYHAHQGRVSFQPQVHSLGCLRPRARAMVGQITSRIGPIQVTSTCGGRHAHNSKHYRGLAIDFRPQATSQRAALAALRGMSIIGGLGGYSGGLIHADAGEARISWYGRGRSRYARHHHRHYRYASYRRHYVRPVRYGYWG